MSSRGDGTFDRHFLFGSTAIQYLTFVGGTAIGAFGGDILGDPHRLGLDAVYPAFFVAILLGELRSRRATGVAAAGAAIAFVLVPLTPPGVPVLVAGVAALAGLRRREVAA
jgi:predicted branched-subunit amino acid permease